MAFHGLESYGTASSPKTAALLTLQLLQNFNYFENGLASSDHS